MNKFRNTLIATAVGASLIAAGPAAATAASPELLDFGTPVLKMVSGSSFDDIFSFTVASTADVKIGGNSSSISINLGTLGTFTIPGVTFSGYSFSAADGSDYKSKGMTYSSSGNDFTLVAKGLNPGTYLFEVTGIISGGSPSVRSALSSGLISSAYGVAAAAALVPEPGEWAMMLAGLGMVGAMVRRRITK